MSTDLVPAASVAKHIALVGPDPGRLDLTTKIKLHNALVGKSLELQEWVDKPFELVNAWVVAHQWEREHGELEDGYKLWMMLKTGETIFGGSQGVAESLILINELWGRPPWPEGIKGHVRSMKATRGRYIWLELELPADKKGGTK